MRKTLIFTGLCLGLVLLFFSTATTALADGSYVVQRGDTLLGVAARYGLSVSDLAAANGMRWSDWLYVGQTLVIPGPGSTPQTPGNDSNGTYTVKRGDTLAAIARSYGTTISALQLANGITNPNYIYVGQRLIIPGGSSSPAPTNPAPGNPPAGAGEKWIDVNLTTQTLTAYEGNTPVFTAIVSTGLPATPTVVGSFPIYVKYQAADMSGGWGASAYYLPDVPYVMYFYQGYGIHGTYWHNNFGTPMSRGCVNLSTPDAQWLYSWAPVGTVVRTHY